MQTVIIVIHLMVVMAMIGAVLLQRSEGGGFAAGSSNSGFLSNRGTANVLTRTTAILAAVFFATSLVLSVLAGMGRKPASILGGGTSAPINQQAPGAPLAPGGSGGVLDALRGGPPAAPPAPSGPQAPRSQ